MSSRRRGIESKGDGPRLNLRAPCSAKAVPHRMISPKLLNIRTAFRQVFTSFLLVNLEKSGLARFFDIFRSGRDILKNRVRNRVDQPEISISVPLIPRKPSKSRLPSTGPFQKSLFKLRLISSSISQSSSRQHPSQNLGLVLKFPVHVSIPQNLPSRTKKYRKFHPPPIFPGSLTRSQY